MLLFVPICLLVPADTLISLASTGFLLDGGVHSAALLRVILPDTPASVVSVSSLHRRLFPPYDTVQALILPEDESITDPQGPTTKLKTQPNAVPRPSGRSVPTGTITMTWALPDLEDRSPRVHQILTVTCLNGRLTLTNDNQIRYLEVLPAAGSDVEPVKEMSTKKGVEVEIAWFANAIQAVRAGKEVDPKEDFGKPINTVWDVAFIQSLLQSNGQKTSIRETLEDIGAK